MLQRYAYSYGTTIHDLYTWEDRVRAGQDKPTELPPWLDVVERQSAELEMETALAKLEWMRASAAQGCTALEMADNIEDLRRRIIDHLKYREFIYVSPAKARLFDNSIAAFGQHAVDRFPIADDVEEAGKCLALGRSTACVFHLMRVLEVGLQALATDLGLTKLERNWQMLIQDVDKEVSALPHSTPTDKEYLSKRAAASSHLKNVKDAWRNDVMHPRAVYTEEQATDIWNHSKALMATLAGFL